ncbi:MAG: TonB family protein [Candidatus Stygibacter frigidus]|nr:TonB family protein [Candidatus Stygibacter frigidus]
MLKQNTERKAIIISVTFHVLVALILFFSRFELDLAPVQKLIEVVNYGVQEPSETGSNTQQPSGIAHPKSNPVQGAQTSSAPDNINLPKSSSQSDQEILEPVNDQIAWSDIKESDVTGNTPEDVRSGLNSPALAESEPQPETEKASVKADKDFLAGLRKRIAAEDSDSGGYTLSGEIINRTILNKIIPEYPEGLQQNSEVQIQFEVTPEGKVNDNIVIIKKGGAQLDQVSLEALKQWRFNPVSGEFVQTGVITFTYKLK